MEESTVQKEFTIDCDKWICGRGNVEECFSTKNSMGLGPTELLNDAGYMCCLGQVSKQLGVGEEHLLCESEPGNLPYSYEDKLSFLVKKSEAADTILFNSDLSNQAMDINDDSRTSIAIKIKKLTDLFAAEGITLNFINVPEWVSKNGD